MLALGIHYLNGWAVASHPADREKPEWPPHPDRVFMALAAAHFETEGDAAEAEALQWLEQQRPPGLSVSNYNARKTVTAYVPVNDTAAPRIKAGKELSAAQLASGLSLLPEGRSRQARHFPVAIPEKPLVYLVWKSDPPVKIVEALDRLCQKVVRIGHSASLVQVWVEPGAPKINLEPAEGIVEHRLRITARGKLDYLKHQFSLGRRPESSLWQGYARSVPKADKPTPTSIFDNRLLILRRVDGRRLGLESTLLLTETLRLAMIAKCEEPVPEWLSGHTPDGRPTRQPHIAFLPLPDIGHAHADGHFLGLAMAIPRELDQTVLGKYINPIIGFDETGEARKLRLYEGDIFEWEIELERRENPPVALQSWPWTQSSRQWASVSPVVFDRHPKGRDQETQTESMVADACERIGLPRPISVVLSDVSLHQGVPHRRRFPPIIRKTDGGKMHHSHVVLTFENPVRGPILIGAGRFRGYGLFRPVRLNEGAKDE